MARPKLEACLRGHIIAEVGRYGGSGMCKQCSRDRVYYNDHARALRKANGAAYMRQRREDGPSLRYVYLPAEPLLRWLQNVPRPRNGALEGSIVRAKRTGRFTLQTADELCVNVLRRHPAEIYGDDWWDIP